MVAKELSPERVHIAKVLKKHIDAAVDELGPDNYIITLQGTFDKTPICVKVEVTAKKGIP
jgi:hypothetical protein